MSLAWPKTPTGLVAVESVFLHVHRVTETVIPQKGGTKK